jgi:hypothetical protein
MKVGLENQSDTMMIRVRNVLENTMNLQSHLTIMPCFWQVEVGMLACSICQKRIMGGQMVSEERVTPQTPISREAHIIYWALWFGTLWCHCYGEYTPFEKQDTRIAALTVRIDPMRQKRRYFVFHIKKYNLLVNELKQINNLSANTISIGQRLIVKYRSLE